MSKFKQGDRVKYTKDSTNLATVIDCGEDARGEFVCVRWDWERDICVGEDVSLFKRAQVFEDLKKSINNSLSHVVNTNRFPLVYVEVYAPAFRTLRGSISFNITAETIRSRK
jgi:hypothetical protein